MAVVPPASQGVRGWVQVLKMGTVVASPQSINTMRKKVRDMEKIEHFLPFQ